MKYARQTQEALDRFDQSLASLRNLIKNGINISVRSLDILVFISFK